MTNKVQFFMFGVFVLVLTACGHDEDIQQVPEDGDLIKFSPDLPRAGPVPMAPGPLPAPGTKAFDYKPFKYRWNGRVPAATAADWTRFTAEGVDDYQLQAEDTPRDILEYCPKFKGLSPDQKKVFWMFMISSITDLESKFDPIARYKEKFGKQHYSRGLMQLGLESVQAYGCPARKEEDLYIPEINLNCGVKILDHWVAKDGVISGKVTTGKYKWRGGARYWAVLRFKTKIIKGWTKTLPFC